MIARSGISAQKSQSSIGVSSLLWPMGPIWGCGHSMRGGGGVQGGAEGSELDRRFAAAERKGLRKKEVLWPVDYSVGITSV